MTYLQKLALIAFSLVFILSVQAQTTQLIKSTDNTSYLSKQLNGLNALLTPQPQATNVQITLNVKTGPVYENDSIKGISYILQNIVADKIANYLRKSTGVISFKNTQLESYTTTELSVFKLTVPAAYYQSCLFVLRDSVLLASFTEKELLAKLDDVRKEISEGHNNYKIVFETELLNRLYRKDAGRQILIGDTSGKYTYIDLNHIKSFYAKYYVPNNTILNVAGNFNADRFENEISDIFKPVLKSKFDPETVRKIIDFKPMVYTTQFVVNAPIEQPEFVLCWQFPGARSNARSSYYAFLLSAMLNDPNNYIQVKARKLGCKKLLAAYDAANFSGTFKITLQPDKQHLFETYDMVVKEIGRLNETLVNESMMKVGMLIFEKEYNNLKNSGDYQTWVTKYWIYDDDTYFSTVKDSVFLIGERRMRKFVIEYLNQSNHVSGLIINETDRKELKVDSIFPSLDPNVANYVFRYKPNITDLEGSENMLQLNNLIDWLTINKDIIVQVNGFADKTEFNKTHDDSIKLFIDSIPTFSKVKQDMVKTGSLRPEMMRAMKIIKYLYDHGITAERLKGTSMPFSSKNDAEALENMKCTVTLDKIRIAPSLHEYHYGKPGQ
jgi:hypothetical protein